MEKIYLEQVNNLIGDKVLPLDDFLNYIEWQLNGGNVICICESEFVKNPNVCFNDFTAFKTWWDTVENKKTTLLNNIAQYKLMAPVKTEPKAPLTSFVMAQPVAEPTAKVIAAPVDKVATITKEAIKSSVAKVIPSKAAVKKKK